MATTVTSTERVTRTKIGTGGGPNKPGPNGKGSHGNGRRHGDQGRGPAQQFSPERYRIAMWVGIAAILMMFVALSSAYIIRSGRKDDWQRIALPHILWASTGLLIISSLSFEAARKALKKNQESAYRAFLALTVALGLGFLVSQVLAWRQLVAQGIYLATNPNSSFFYLLTGAHGLHLLGGILALFYLLARTWRKYTGAFASERRETAAGTVSLYWHFMDGLWIYLFLLLLLWR